MRKPQRVTVVLPLTCLIGLLSAPLRAEQAAAAPTEAAAGAETAKPAPVDDQARAQQLFMEGMELYDAGTFGTALERFRDSFEAVKSPNSRLMIARSLRGLGSLGAAFQTYELALQDAEVAASDNERYADTASAAREELASLRPAVGLVVIHIEGDAPSDATLAVGGIPVERELWNRPIAVTPGTAEIVLDADGRLPARETLEIEAGKTRRLSLVLGAGFESDAGEPPAPVDDSKKSLRTGAYVAGGIGLAGLVTFGLGVSTDASSTISVLGIVTAGLGIGGGLTLYILSEEDDDKGAPRTALDIGPGSIRLRGTF
jgi:hypothetical protein